MGWGKVRDPEESPCHGLRLRGTTVTEEGSSCSPVGEDEVHGLEIFLGLGPTKTFPTSTERTRTVAVTVLVGDM